MHSRPWLRSGSRLRGRRAALLPAMSLGVLVAVILPAVPAAAGPGQPVIRLSTAVADRCVAGYAPSGAALTVILRRSDGSALESTSAQASPQGGFFQTCFNAHLVTAGRKVTVKAGPTRRTITIPRLDARLDRVGSVLSGNAPGGAKLQGELWTCIPGGCQKIVADFILNARPDGSFRRTLPIDVDGSDYATLALDRPSGDRFWVRPTAPYLEARVSGPTRVNVVGGRLGPVSLTLRAGNGSLRARASTTVRIANLSYSLTFRLTGSPVVIKQGNIIDATFAADVDFTVPSLTLLFDDPSNLVTADCFPNQAFIASNTTRGGSYQDVADAIGTARASLSIESGDEIIIDCEDRKGDRIRVEGIVP